MKKIITLAAIIFLLTSAMRQDSKSYTPSELNTACFVLSEVVEKARRKSDGQTVLIMKNAFDRLSKYGKPDTAYTNFFKKAGISYRGFSKPIIISFNESPKMPGFTHKQVQLLNRIEELGLTLEGVDQLITQKQLNTLNAAPSLQITPQQQLQLEQNLQLSPQQLQQLQQLQQNGTNLQNR